MKKCPRCGSSMLLDHSGTLDGYDRVWKCMGCGRELYADRARQEADERLVEEIRAKELRSF